MFTTPQSPQNGPALPGSGAHTARANRGAFGEDSSRIDAALTASASDAVGAAPSIGTEAVNLTELDEAVRSARAAEARQFASLGKLMRRISGHAAGVGKPPANLEMEYRSLRLEIAARLHITEHGAAKIMDAAHQAYDLYPTCLASLAEGVFSSQSLHVITEEGLVFASMEPVTAEVLREAYEAAVLPHARVESPNRLRPIANRLAAELAKVEVEEQYAQAKSRRCVRVFDLPDGMAELVAYLPATLAYGIRDRMRQVAKQVLQAERADLNESRAARTTAGAQPEALHTADQVHGIPVDAAVAGQAESPGMTSDIGSQTTTASHTITGSEANSGFADAAGTAGTANDAGTAADAVTAAMLPVRAMSEIEADVFSDMLLTGEIPVVGSHAAPLGRAISGHVQVVVPGHTLKLEGTTPANGGVAELIGYGPISDHAAREVAADTDVWEKIEVDLSGIVLSVDRYRPTPQMMRFLSARDIHCRAPGCRARAQRCDVDHTIDAARGGPTRTDNLAVLCRGHHVLKHHSRWKVKQHSDGVLTWTSPTGRDHVEQPPSRVRFQAAPPPPPSPPPAATGGPAHRPPAAVEDPLAPQPF